MAVILSDLLDIIWDVTELNVLAYDEYRLQHEWIFGNQVEETVHQWHRRRQGVLSIIDRKINHHNDPKKNGIGEMGWGVNKGPIPEAILQAKVTTMNLTPASGRFCGPNGRELTVQVDMDKNTVLMVKEMLADVERPLEEEEKCRQ